MKKVVAFYENELARIIVGAILFLAAVITERIELFVVSGVLYVSALVYLGAPVFISAVRRILQRDFLDEKFLMSIASFGAMIVGERSEGVAVMLFFLIGEFFEHKAVARSRKSIKSLMDICPDTANVLVMGEEINTDAEDVEVGSLIVLRAGERVPIDSVVIDGTSLLDVSMLSGEAFPKRVNPGDEIKSGTVLLDGVLTAKTLRVAGESAAARILELVENANESKSKEENFITKFSKIYTPIVVLLAVIIAVIPPLFKLVVWSESIYRALIFLVISCPCALVISVPMAFFGGIGKAASMGILFKGGNTFAPISKIETVAFDKTGTLTTGKFSVEWVKGFGVSENEVLTLAASAEYGSNHPISIAIKSALASCSKPEYAEEISGKGVRAKLIGDEILVGNAALMRDYCVSNLYTEEKGVYVAKNGKLIGIIKVADKIKSEAESSVERLRALGAKKLVMISGDKRENAESVANTLAIDEVFYELLPEEKYQKLEELISDTEGSVMYVGDGINDAPCLARADVGVAMGNIGADSAISAADLVLISDNLENLPRAVKIARKTVSIAKQNIAFALGVKLAVMALGAFGITNMWFAVFADVGVAILAILNSMRTFLIKK